VGLTRQGGRGGEPERGQGYRKLWQQVTKARARGRGVLRCPPAHPPAPGDCGTARCPPPSLSRPALAALARCTMVRGDRPAHPACSPVWLVRRVSRRRAPPARAAARLRPPHAREWTGWDRGSRAVAAGPCVTPWDSDGGVSGAPLAEGALTVAGHSALRHAGGA